MLAAVVHSLWTRARAGRRELAILRAIGFTRPQLVEVMAWQALPVAAAGMFVGLPVGVVAGSWGFTRFARTLHLVDTATVPVATVAGLAIAVLLSAVAGFLAAQAVAGSVRPSLLLREQ